MRDAEVVVIGGGVGGYTCAIRSSQLGLKTILVEKDRLGGECLIAGCIPSKAMISMASLYFRARNSQNMGLTFSDARLDMPAFQKWKSGVIASLENGVANLCRGNKVELLRGEAAVKGPGRVTVKTEAGLEEINAKNIVLATGSKPISLPGLELDGQLVVGSRDALELQSVPESILVIGGGYIGLEIGSMYQKLGSRITVVEMTDQLLPGVETDLVRLVQRNIEKRGGLVLLKSKVTSLDRRGGKVTAQIATAENALSVEASLALVSVGRAPSNGGLDLTKLGVVVDQRGYVPTDERMMTNVSGVFAIGDLRGQPLLAHKAAKEGVVAAEVIAGLPSAADWRSIPWAIFTDPEVAGAGLSEKDAVAAGHEVKRSRISFAALGRAVISGESEGFVKMISDAKTGLVLGVQIAGPEASNLISEAALAIEMGATVEDIASTIHPHPTLPEAIMQAAETAAGRPVHQLRI